MIIPSKCKIPLLIFFCALCAFTTGLYSAEIIRINCRFALFTAEIGQYGLGLFPTLYGKPYTDYPSTMVYFMYLASWGGRYINMLTLTLPTALAAAYLVMMTYLIGRKISKRLGLYAVCFLFLSFEFLSIARAPNLDVFTAAATITAFYLMYSADLSGRPWCWRLVWLPFCVAFSFAVRGPMGVLIPAAVIIAYYLVNRRWMATLWSAIVCGLTALLCMWFFLQLCAWQGGHNLLWLFFDDQILSRFGSTKPFWYFFTNAAGSYALTYPLALLVIVVYGKKLCRQRPDEAKPHETLLRLLAGWILIVLLGMSIPGTKHLRYVVPVIPAMALLCGLLMLNFDHLKLFDWLKKYLLRAAEVLPFATLLAVVINFIVFRYGLTPAVRMPFFMPILICGILCLLVILTFHKSKPSYREMVLLAVAACTMVVIRAMIVMPVENAGESSRQFVADAEQSRRNARLHYYFLGPDGDELKYLVNLPAEKRFIGRYVIPPDPRQQPTDPEAPASRGVLKLIDYFPNDRQTVFLPRYDIQDDIYALLQFPAEDCFLTRQERFDALPADLKKHFEVVAAGQLGHQDGVIFRRKNVTETTQ